MKIPNPISKFFSGSGTIPYFRICRLPVRLFHSAAFGAAVGALAVIAIHHSAADGTGASPPAPVVLNPTPDDLDGDGIPNAWETQHHHDPDLPADAASDFDNDGLTTLQEYQLSISSAGASGNPLGSWTIESVQIPASLGVQYPWPQAMNRNGEVLLNCYLTPNGGSRQGAVLMDSQHNWHTISNPDCVGSDSIWVSDINDNGQVVGSWTSPDYTDCQGFTWSVVSGYATLSYNGRQAFPFKMNNSGDWVGYTVDGFGSQVPAYVVDGVNMHSNGWPFAYYQDINDFGEALGVFDTCSGQGQHAFLAYGPWLYDTGLLGAEPSFDPNTFSWNYTVALNAWGEFVAGAGGEINGEWTSPGYVFDGGFHEINSPRLDLISVLPSSISSDQVVAGCAGDNSWQCFGFICRDGVIVRADELISGAGTSNTVVVSDDGRLAALSEDQQTLIIATPDQDADGDGMSDDWEVFYGFNPQDASDAFLDADGDGTSNRGEFLLRSDPNHAPVFDANGNEIDIRPGIDTDGDGIPNVWEWENGLNYADPSDAPLDYDRDGYSNLQEFHLNTDPRGAPTYRIRELGPFPGASGVSLSSAVLGDGSAPGSCAGLIGSNVTESVFFAAMPSSTTYGGWRPAVWSLLRSGEEGTLSFAPSCGSQGSDPVVQATSGASLFRVGGNPTQFAYWANPAAAPVMLSGAAAANDIAYLHNVRFSPSGSFLVATRALASAPGSYQPIVWKMPQPGEGAPKPVPLLPPAGTALSDWPTLYVNDFGCVVATGTVSGNSRPILWTVNQSGTGTSAIVLSPLSGGNFATASGISNQAAPLVCGTSGVANGQQRATVWDASGTATNLGTLAGGNYSIATLISRGGKIAGVSSVLVGNALKYQPFLAFIDPATSGWRLQAQGNPSSNDGASLLSLNDSGEILGHITEYSPALRQIPCLWRHGREHRLDVLVPASSGHTLDTCPSINPDGTLLATTWKDGAKMTVLLTPDSDTDGDGLPDAFENQNAFNAFSANACADDTDSDGLPDIGEYRNGTNPRDPDTDHDGMKDGWEVSWGLLPLDPSDAGLDPDGDHVTNLRESQIGTTPTGIYKVEARLVDTEDACPDAVAADNTGKIIYAGQWQYNDGIDSEGYQFDSYGRGYYALGAAGVGSTGGPVTLPGYYYYSRSMPGGGQSCTREDFPQFWFDAASGLVHGAMSRSTLYYDASAYEDAVTCFLIPDAVNSTGESGWIPWANIEGNLRDRLVDNGYYDADGVYVEDFQFVFGAIDGTDSVSPFAEAVSPSGTRRIHRSAMGWCLVLNESGEFTAKLPATPVWQKIDDQGRPITLTTRYVAAANGLPAYQAPELKVANSGAVETIPIPNEPGISPGYTLQDFSNDGKVLLSRTARNVQLATTVQYYLFDLNTRTLTRVRQPGFGNESIASMSLENARLLGNGKKPFQITPDGTCVRLEALRIKDSPAAAVTFGTLYPKASNPTHISSAGRITLTTTDSLNRTVILQIVPNNDADGDGVPDDWEMEFRGRMAEIFGVVEAPADASSYNVNHDYGNTGLTAASYFSHLANTGQILLHQNLFSMNTLYPSFMLDTGFIYYLNKKPVKFHSFVQGATCEGYGHFHSCDPLDPCGYREMKYTEKTKQTGNNTSGTYVVNSLLVNAAGVDKAVDFLKDTRPTEFPEYKRFWDATHHISLESTVTTTYNLEQNAPPDKIWKTVETSNPDQIKWIPETSISYDQVFRVPAPDIPAILETITKGGSITTSPSMTSSFATGLGVWDLQVCAISGGMLESNTKWKSGWSGTEMELEASQPVAWRNLSNEAYDFAKSRAKSDFYATARTTIHGEKANHDEFGKYQKVAWVVEGPDDYDHTLMVEKTYCKSEPDGEYRPHKEYRIIPLKAGSTITITEEADPGDDWETVMIKLDILAVEVRDLKGTGDADDVTVSFQVNDEDTSENNIAWIEPIKSAQDKTPRMPQLQISLSGAPANLKVKWRMENRYPRRNGRDDMNFPKGDGNPVKELPADKPWKIYEEYSNPDFFFGGNCTIFMTVLNANGTIVCPEQQFKFRIRGKNPEDADCKAHIVANQGAVWYAWAIAKHESKDSNGFYNQFATGLANGEAGAHGTKGEPFYAPVDG